MARRKNSLISPRSEEQTDLIKAFNTHPIILCNSLWGTGKSFLAIGHGCERLIAGKIERLVLTRSAYHLNGEMGFMSGSLHEKTSNYLAQQVEYLKGFLGNQTYDQFVKERKIQLLPIGLIRGYSFDNMYIVADELQNSTKDEFSLLISRLGRESTMVLLGDASQSTLGNGCYFAKLFDQLEDEDVAKIKLTKCFRHKSLVRIFNKMENIH